MAESRATEDQLGSPTATPSRVLITIPVFTHVEPDPFGNFLCMALMAGRTATNWNFDVAIQKRKLLHGAMNEIVETVLKHGHAGLIVCDDDCLPPYDAIPRLMAHATAGYNYVAGVGVMKNFPHTTTVGRYFPEGVSLVTNSATKTAELRGFEWVDDIDGLPAGLNEVDFCGLPIAWMSRRVLEAIERPWFGTHIDGGDCTHDVYFAKKVQRAGFKVHVDTTIRCQHTALPGIVSFENRGFVRGMMANLERGQQMAQEQAHGAV